MIAQDFIKIESIGIMMPLDRELIDKIRQKTLCIAYDLFTDPGHFVFIEEWPDRGALDAYCASEQFQRLASLSTRISVRAARSSLCMPSRGGCRRSPLGMLVLSAADLLRGWFIRWSQAFPLIGAGVADSPSTAVSHRNSP
ncbi:putative quinol monooxygenase [Neomegalonema perideroedes]|uniref:putative quinol monooxygenase n=1 Tax=Neomegalonema perideroedes TaxID=217219 RepID=UPI001969D0E5|nr:putative quinol monooxygenase [Neomegalonema perideroedes]